MCAQSGYLIGIIYELYFEKSIAFILLIIGICFFLLKKVKLNFKIPLNKQIILLICLSSLFSNTYTLYLNNKYNSFYKNVPQNINANAVIIGEAEEKEYYCKYLVKIRDGTYKNKKFYINVKKNKKGKLEYGNLISLKGEYLIPSKARNYKGFDYREYLKTKKIYGTIKIDSYKIVEKNNLNYFLILSNRIRVFIINKSNSLLPKETSALLNGILLGDKSGIEENIIENFKESNLSHLLAVSGAHTGYIIIGITFLLNKSRFSKRWIYKLTIFSLSLYMFITNFAVSVVRACLTSIFVLVANLFYRKADLTNTISLSLLIILLVTPFSINEIGLQLSYLGTIGIVLLSKNIENILIKIKLNKFFAKLLSVCFSAQCLIMPIMALKFNKISLTFFISNILASSLLGINIILGFITIFISSISINIGSMLAILLNFSLKALIVIAEFSAKIPLNSILVKTPYIITIIFLYIVILGLNYIYSNGKLSLFQKRFFVLIKNKNFQKVLVVVILLIFLSNLYTHISQDLKIHFIDVGQGDSCLIITPNNKKILIDGGEGKTDVLLSYLLDRRIKTIDYIIISHFDSDHCNGLIDIIKSLKVKNIMLAGQAYFSDEYINIANIINSKQINVTFVKQGDSFNISKDVKLDILYPQQELEYKDLNNNSIMAKLTYNSFSILFTGDVEKAEDNILNSYRDVDLKSTVLKLAHHGSKTSSSKEFLEAVKPKIALIGVGENNKFGHPSPEVLQRLNDINCKIYRTDKMGEITIYVNGRGKIKIKTQI